MSEELRIARRLLPLTAAGAAAIHALVTGVVLTLAYVGHLALLDASPTPGQVWTHLGHGLCLGISLLPATLLAARTRIGSLRGRRLALLALLPATLAAALFASVQATFLGLLLSEGEVAGALSRLSIRLELLLDELGWEVLLASRWVLPPWVLLVARSRGWSLKLQMVLTAGATFVGLLTHQVGAIAFYGDWSIESINAANLTWKEALEALLPPNELALAAGWALLPPSLLLGDLIERRWEGRSNSRAVTTARASSRWQRAREDLSRERRSLVKGGALGLATLTALVALAISRDPPPPPERPPQAAWSRSQARRHSESLAKRRARDTPERRRLRRLRDKLREARSLQYGHNKLDEALARFNEAVAMAPDEAEAYASRARLFSALGTPNLALADLNRAVDLKPKDMTIRGQRSFVRLALGDTHGALEDQLELSDVDPEVVHPYLWRANLRVRLGQDELALQELCIALTLDSESSWWIYCERGNVYSRLGRINEALSDYDKALEAQPRAWWVYRARASTLRMVGDTRRADLDQARGARDQFGPVFARLWTR